MKPAQPALQHSAKSGYAAIISVVIIGIIIVLIGTAVTYLAIGNVQSSLGYTQGERAKYLANSCLEDVLLTYNNTNTLPLSSSLPEGSCTINIVSQTSTTASITVSTTLQNHNVTIALDLLRNSSVSIVNYSQLN